MMWHVIQEISIEVGVRCHAGTFCVGSGFWTLFCFVATPYDFDVIHLEPPSSSTKACGPKTRSLTRASHTGAAWPVGQSLDRWLPKGLLGLGDGLNIE